MNYIENQKDNLQRLAKMIAEQFGKKCEVVVHDLSQDYESTIVAIENNHITGRQVGDCGSNLGLEVLRGTTEEGDRYKYTTRTTSGRILRSSSTYLRDENNKVVGSICINFDITDLLMADSILKEYWLIDNNNEEEVNEVFANNVNELLDYFIIECQKKIGKLPDAMSKEEKISAIQYLDKKGVFLITKSGDRVCEYLGISKYTLYTYLDISRKNGA
ncbi:Predicted transcriptional regulator YheO, contains PAS and DNA-binding HTH domains [Anaerovirgula multivorans]|uniref:Predicted transcriptional regulator YheO, contains PAS and DNA-binding HTH domains n=1 Tax=Anaerovirgula multivorans TaxID=312168 RepID=A0A239IDG0_9FIRM|nr:helix-turn-helix transcriptional regulator [Anaerovirgula multivorans]SNS91063.1 Predicted transcriptional regulator YheO, contains PAS and DNA-binding HTH domains [Anaerovirgula multivorans]